MELGNEDLPERRSIPAPGSCQVPWSSFENWTEVRAVTGGAMKMITVELLSRPALETHQRLQGKPTLSYSESTPLCT